MFTFLLIAVFLTAVACLAVAIPLLKPPPGKPEGASYDIEVYRDQLDEIDADTARGLIAEAEAVEARAEIGRRILGIGANDGSPGKPRRSGGWIAALAVLAIPLLSAGIYAVNGSPGLPGQPLQTRLDRNPAENTIEELIARAEMHLAENPEDGRGWDVIAPIYVRVQRYPDAVKAYGNAIRIAGSDARRQSGLGEALTAVNQGLVPEAARAAFAEALQIEPSNAKARFFMAMAEAQAGDPSAAIARWQALVEDSPEQSPWRVAAVNAIGATRSRMEAEAQSDRPGPTGEDIAAAQDMAAGDRQAMIESMVAGLAAKLEENPGDREGWQRLVRSYVVLGKREEALLALEKGVNALQDQPGASEELARFASGLGLEKVD